MYFVSLCSDKHITVDISDDYDCLETVIVAIEDSNEAGVDFKAEIGEELIGMLNQVLELYHHDYEEDFRRRGFKERYQNLQEMLGFPYQLSDSLVVYIEPNSDSSEEEFSEDE